MENKRVKTNNNNQKTRKPIKRKKQTAKSRKTAVQLGVQGFATGPSPVPRVGGVGGWVKRGCRGWRWGWETSYMA